MPLTTPAGCQNASQDISENVLDLNSDDYIGDIEQDVIQSAVEKREILCKVGENKFEI